MSVHHSCPGVKSGVSSSFLPGKVNRHRDEIRCQFIILDEIRCQFIILARERERKSGVSSSFLPGKVNRHRITFGKVNSTPDLPVLG